MATQVPQIPTCNKHHEEAVALFCVSCDENMCTTCVIENTHSQHKLCKPHQILEMKRKEFKDLIETEGMDKIREKISLQVKLIQKHNTNVSVHQSQTSTAIENRSAKLMQIIEKEKKSLLMHSKRLHDQQLNFLSNQESVAKRCLAFLEKHGSDPESFLNTHQDEMQQVVRDLKLVQTYIAPTDIKAVVSFDTSHEVTEVDIKKIVGTIREQMASDEKKEHAHKHMELVNTYRLILKEYTRIRKTISKISPIDMQTAFVLVGDSYLFRVQFSEEHEILPIKHVATNVKDITKVGDKGIYLCTGTQVKLYTMKDDMYVLDDVSPDTVRSVTLTEEGQVLVCCVGQRLTFDPTREVKYSKLHVLDQTGIKISTGTPFDTNAGDTYRVGKCCGELYYLRKSQKAGAVQKTIGFSAFVNIYTGNLGSSPEKSFDPRGICCDDKDQIIIADYNNCAIHLLGKGFRFMKFLLREWDGLNKPTAITLYNGFLWIGQEDGNIQLRKYES
ncbi:uncharacterized protein LOC110449657 [Mizuhopecten yessoensis]|uniref:uncharacterized protein LOC110449657 n=1 Tax=Mizuhopecten yessoensis TaxID=6573 RepID=UPI000B45F8D8|nr:uncharacterized protein LOC110449657 [Mizuhopecten yessoensis]